jgi:hypothetical protein
MRMRTASWALIIALLFSQGCVSFAYSRFTPERSDAGAGECSDVAPFADGVIALLLGIGGLTLDGLSRGAGDCGQYPNDPKCHPHFGFYVPALVAAASMTYGTAAYFVCESRVSNVKSGDWRPQASKP